MTLTTTASKVVCLGNGSTTAFVYSFLIPLATDVVVTYTDALGNSTQLSTSQYTATPFGNPAGGTITFPTSGSPIASGTTLTIQRVVPLTQGTSISNQGAFYPEVVEAALDTATMQIQQLNTAIINSLQVPLTDSSAPTTLPGATQRAGQMLGFDSQGNPIAASPSSALVSSVMQPFVSAASLAAAANLLGLPVFVGVGTTTGTANAQILAGTVPGSFTFVAGNKIAAIPGFTNTGPMTLAVGVIPATSVFKRSAAGPIALAGGEVVLNQIANFTCDGTHYILEEQGAWTSPTIITPTLTLKNSTNPTPTAEGDTQWDNDDNVLVIGDGAGQQIFLPVPASVVAGDVFYATGPRALARLAKGTALQALLMNAGATAPNWATLPFTKSYDSGSQTITAGGSLTLAHSLGVQPKLYQVYLKNVTADIGFSPGDEFLFNPLGTGGSQNPRGCVVLPDATNLNVSFSNDSNNIFANVISKGTGALVNISNANLSKWASIFRAWA